MKKTYKILLIVAAVLAVVVAIVAIAISPVVKNYVEKHDKELIGRTIRMEKLKINIFTGRLRIESLRIGGADDSTTFARLDSFDMRLRLLPLISNRVHISHLKFVRPDIKVYQRGSKFSFDDLVDRFMSDTTTVEDTSSTPWEIGIYNISIKDGHLFYKDMLLNATWGMNDIDLQVPGVYFGGRNTDVGAVLNFADGGSLSTDLKYDIESEQFDINLRLNDFALAGTLPYFRQSLNVDAVEGKLTADVRLRGDVEHLLSVRTDGTASLSKFALIDNLGRPAITVDTLGMKLAEADLGQMRFRFDRLYVGGFSTFYEMTAEGDNYTVLMTPADPAPIDDEPMPELTAEEIAEAEASSPAPTLHIADMEIAGGSITLRDMTMHRPFEYHVTDIRMRSRDFDLAGRNNLVVDAKMAQTGAAKLRWVGSMEDMNNHDITFSMTNIDIRDFGPYCEHFTAYPITNGNLTFRSQNVIRNRYLNGTNHLDMFEPKVDSKLKNLKPEMSIPLKLGLYVLKDKKGHVQMDLPVKGSLDSPEFSYRKIVLKAIGNVLLKVVTAPFSFLSGGNHNLEYINVDPQSFTFSSEQYASFDKIAQTLQDKPEMKIELTQRINLKKALPVQTANALRMAYATHLKTADSVARRRLSMLEYEKIQQMDIRTPAIVAFADSLLAQRGIAAQGMSAQDKATALYREQATAQIFRSMAMRNRSLGEYMQTTHSITDPAFRLQATDSAAVHSYTGRDRYTIALEVDGEVIEVESSDDADSGAETPAEGNAVTDSGAPAANGGTTASDDQASDDQASDDQASDNQAS